MASRPKTSRKLEVSVEAVEDSRGGFYAVVAIGDVKLNLTSRCYETVDAALDAGNKNLATMLELTLRNLNSHILLQKYAGVAQSVRAPASFDIRNEVWYDVLMEVVNSRHQSIEGDALGLYPSKEGSSPSGGSCLYCSSNTSNPKFCSKSCAAKYNNHANPKRKKRTVYCLNCNEPLDRTQNIYCSINCHQEDRQNQLISAWLENREDGLSTNGTARNYVKRWLRNTRGDKCELCGWSEVNPKTGTVPVVADHIDGDYRNNRPENLRLICPNCDSIQPTYKALNKGKGREWRRKKP